MQQMWKVIQKELQAERESVLGVCAADVEVGTARESVQQMWKERTPGCLCSRYLRREGLCSRQGLLQAVRESVQQMWKKRELQAERESVQQMWK